MDFSIFSPTEFEQLCCDILKVSKNIDGRTFKECRDGGIDILKKTPNMCVVGQCKRYTTGKFNLLKKELKKEVEKVKKINPDCYYVFTSMHLSKNQVIEIYDMFKPYIKDVNDIFDGNIIENCLKDEKYKDAFKKNIKLWINSINVLHSIFPSSLNIDISTLESSIENHKKYYVETSFLSKTLKELKDKKAILVEGSAGSGKTTLCEMVVLSMKRDNDNLKLIYTSSRDYENLKKELAKEHNGPILVYLDDFVGQTCLELSEKELSEIKTIINYILNSKSIYLLINSRVYILNDVSRINDSLFKIFESSQFSIIKLDKFSDIEKAEILCAHLRTNCVDYEKIEKINEERNYLKIVNHKNYNPRLIEYIAKENLEAFSPDEYFNYCIEVLNNPQKIWKDQFEKIMQEDRALLEILYILTSGKIDKNILYECFNNQKSNKFLFNNLDLTSSSIFENSIQRLNGTFVNLSTNGVNTFVEVANPSINDFLKENFNSKSKDIIKEYRNHFIYIEQFIRMEESFLNSESIEFLHDTKFFENPKYISLNNYGLFMLALVNKYTQESDSKKRLLYATKLIANSDSFSFEPMQVAFGPRFLLKEIFTNEKLLAINISSFSENEFLDVKKVFNKFLFPDDICCIYESCNNIFTSEQFDEQADDIYSDMLYDEVEDIDFNQLIKDEIDGICYCDEFDKAENYIDDITEAVTQEALIELEKNVSKNLNFTKISFIFRIPTNYDYESAIESKDIERLIYDYINPYDFDYSDYKDDLQIGKNSNDVIDNMFSELLESAKN